MDPIKNRAGQRPLPRVSRAQMFQQRIEEDMARRAALPKDHPDYASPDKDIDDNKIRRDESGKEIAVPKKNKNKGK